MRIGMSARVLLAAVVALSGESRAQTMADSVRPFLVVAPAGERWFVAASHGKRILLDIGRVDLAVHRDSALAAGFREAAAARTTVPVGTEFLLRTPWGEERVRSAAIDAWNDRIVLVLEGGSARLDSARLGEGEFVASAERLPRPGERSPARRTAPPTRVAGCDPTAPGPRIPARLAPRLIVLRDSLVGALRAQGPAPSERLQRRISAASSHVTGCFGRARAVLVASLRTPATEWTRERAVLVDSAGRASSVRIEDLRFLTHDLRQAFDADGDGLDDLIAVGRRHRAGGTTILRYDPGARRFVRLAAGFSWEDF